MRTVTARPNRTMGRSNFVSEMNSFFDQVPDAFSDLAVAQAQIDAAVVTVTSGLSAGLWVSGTTYAIGDKRFSPATGLLYLRITAGAGTTDPSADTANWRVLAVQLPALQVSSATTFTATASSRVALTSTSAATYKFPATPAAGDWVFLKFANGRQDNVLDGNGANVEGQGATVTVDIPGYGGLWQYINSTYGWGEL